VRAVAWVAALVVVAGAGAAALWPRGEGAAPPAAAQAPPLSPVERARRERVAALVRPMRLGLSAADEARLVAALSGFQEARLAFWARPEVAAMGETEYAAAYGAFVAGHAEAVRAIVPDRAAADGLVRRFVDDGRVVPRPPR
jgi:hypothetical protein